MTNAYLMEMTTTGVTTTPLIPCRCCQEEDWLVYWDGGNKIEHCNNCGLTTITGAKYQPTPDDGRVPW